MSHAFVRKTFDRACAWPVAWRIAWMLFALILALYGCARAQAQSPNRPAVARGDQVARLVPEDASDVAAYITSLKESHPSEPRR